MKKRSIMPTASVEDEREMTDIVRRTLETQGVLNKIRADLRAAVYQVINEETPTAAQPPLLATADGELLSELIGDFFNCLELKQTKSVYQPESQYNNTKSRPELLEALQLVPQDHDEEQQQPILIQMLRAFRELKQKQSLVSTKAASSPPKTTQRSPPKAKPLSPPKQSPPKQSPPKQSPPKQSPPKQKSPLKSKSPPKQRTSPAKQQSPPKQQQQKSPMKQKSPPKQQRASSPGRKSPRRSPNKKSSPSKLSQELNSLNAKIDEMEKEDSSLKELKATLEKELANPTTLEEADAEEDLSDYGSDFEEDFEEEIIEESNSFEEAEEEEEQAPPADLLDGYDYIEVAKEP